MDKCKLTLALLSFIVLFHGIGMCQDTLSVYDKVYTLPDEFFNTVKKKSENIQSKISKQTEKYLSKLERHEKKLQKKLWKKDSIAAKELFGDVESRYNGLKSKINNKSSILNKYTNNYSGHLDSMKTALEFLNHNKLLKESSQLQGQISGLMGEYSELQQKLNQTAEIRKYLKLRQEHLKSQLEKFGLAKEFRKFQKDLYYYRAQMDEYKKMWEDPSKMEAKLLEVARKVPAFKKFFAKYSELGQLFPMPDGTQGSVTSIAGLQTRAMVQQDFQQRFGTSVDVRQMVQQNLQSANTQLNQLKDKIKKLGTSGSDLDIPDFKPNSQKTKSFWKRVEVGTNIQTGKSNSFFPVTSDLGLSVGYKLNDKSVVGIGVSYKMGLGQNIRNLKITQEGVGFRSFLDVKLKGSFYASGGFEYNYQKAFNSMQQLYVFEDWQQSGLLGVSKIVSLNNKFFKKTKVQMLWDFLSYKQRPASQPIKFRVGYNF